VERLPDTELFQQSFGRIKVPARSHLPESADAEAWSCREMCAESQAAIEHDAAFGKLMRDRALSDCAMRGVYPSDFLSWPWITRPRQRA
jgi:hypothetical protein